MISKRSVISNPRLGYGLFDGSVLQDTNECVSALTVFLSRGSSGLVSRREVEVHVGRTLVTSFALVVFKGGGLGQ